LEIGSGWITEEETFLVLDESTITQERQKHPWNMQSKGKNVSGDEERKKCVRE
jgi:hypothetical protein